MGKRAGTGACQPTLISQRPRRRRKKTLELDDAAAASSLGSCSATSQVERQRSMQGKKKPIRARGLRSTATAQARAQARLRRRDLSVSWRAKRLRTARSGPAVGSRWRDWAGLPEGPAGLIADRVLANDVADYVRFRAACLPWRRCCADPRARGVLEDPRLYPRRWIMLRDDYEKLGGTAAGRHGIIRRRFLNTGTGQCVQADVPELRDHGVLRGAADGLLVLYHDASKVVRVLNPLTRQVAELPPTTGLVKCEPCGAGLVDHGTVYLCSDEATMAIARPGDDRWTLLDSSRVVFRSTVFSVGRFYALTGSGIVTVDVTGGGGGGGPCLVAAAEWPKSFRPRAMTDAVHLVDNGDGDLRLVHRMQRAVRDYDGDITHKRRCRVYSVDLSTGKTTDRGRRNLGGRAIFIDYYGALSVSPRVFPFLSEDTIYLGLHCDERNASYGHIGAYHVRDGSTEPPCDDRHRLAHPLSIADSLIAFVSG